MISEDDHHGDGEHRPAPTRTARRSRSRSRFAIGTAGLATVLGVGAYLTTSMLITENEPAAQDVRAVTPATPDLPAGETTTPPERDETAEDADARETTPPARATPTKTATTAVPQAALPEKDPEQARKEITAAREQAEKDGYPVRRPLDPGPAGAAVSERTVPLPGGGTMRIATSDGDLTGQRPLSWAGDEGNPVGANRCTNRFRFSQGEPAGERPTMLMCWRTSATRSVAVLSVTPGGTPSAAESATVIEREWKELG